MFCSKCGAQVAADARVCPNCGEPFTSGAPTPPPPAAMIYVARPGIKAQTGRWVSEGWRMVTTDLGNYALMTLLYVVINSFASIVTQGPLTVGFHRYTMKKIFNRPTEIGDMFKGFDFFLPAFVATLLISLFVSIGVVLCIIPGLIVAAMYKFTYLFILDKRMDFWPAMQASHEVVKNDYLGYTLFMLALAGINILGALCCIVGLFVTIPLSIVAITVAYQEVVGFEQRTVDSL
jgi:uncharacterized membrane protein